MVTQIEVDPVKAEDAARLCVEHWKLIRACSRLMGFLEGKDAQRLTAQLRFSELQLSTIASQMGFSIVTFDGVVFEPGLAASADNAEDFTDDELLVVTRTVEPALVRNMKVVATGRVLVGRPGDNGVGD